MFSDNYEEYKEVKCSLCGGMMVEEGEVFVCPLCDKRRVRGKDKPYIVLIVKNWGKYKK